MENENKHNNDLLSIENSNIQPIATIELPRCEKCTSHFRLGKWRFFDLEITICESCFQDQRSLQSWFCSQLEAALSQSPDFEQMSDGRWRVVNRL